MRERYTLTSHTYNSPTVAHNTPTPLTVAPSTTPMIFFMHAVRPKTEQREAESELTREKREGDLRCRELVGEIRMVAAIKEEDR